MDNLDAILSQYDKNLSTYTNCSNSLKSLLISIFESEGIIVHSVSSRVKERNSLENKTKQKNKYQSINDITDIVGVRIITHYSDDVDKVSNLIEREFNIDSANSIDKRASLEPEKFGYLSVHYVARFNNDRDKLLEYQPFKKIKFEIQIRSILQHTWAEIEHDTGYKTETDIPAHIRRQFSRLAGLLEIADSEFIRIRNSLESYADEVNTKIENSTEELLIDSVTLEQFIKNNSYVIQLTENIENVFGGKSHEIDRDTISRYINELSTYDIKSISQLLDALKEHEDAIMEHSNNVYEKLKDKIAISQLDTFLIGGVAIYYLINILEGNISE
ncbi:hypothetical protein MD588_11330 [Photobacterium sp. SDRW27]|uniref:GTP pyrophosphokinase n=1 Tax=Photobacterium obscurum TaxID=2829490 RepID=UPI0022445550|nr:hypothetical protein [Photobacterium obscurum]MCW8329399.1 hypothetical protein [Photobacterium obscurum]